MSVEAIKLEHKSAHNHQQVCRLCLSEELLDNIFKCNDLILWISDYLSIVVSENDKVSQSICALCRARLNEFREFQLRCLEVQDVLQGGSCTPFENDLPLREAENRKPSSEAQCELTIRHKGVQPFSCEHGCANVEFSSRQKQLIHHRDIHSEKRYGYNSCNKVVRIKGNHRMHKVNIPKPKSFLCSFCNLQLASRLSLNRHMERMHNPTRKKKFSCPHCNRSFKKNGYLQMHLMQIHLMELLEKSRKGLKSKSVEKQDSLEATKVKIELDTDSVETQNELQNDSYVAVEGHLDLFEPEEAKIEPELNPEQGKDDSTTDAEEGISLLESEGVKNFDQTAGIRKELLPKLQDAGDVLKSQERARIVVNVQLERIGITETRRNQNRKIYAKEMYEKQKIMCPICDKSIHPSEMPGHQNKHKGIRPFKCRRGCENVAFFSQKQRQQHYRNTHNGQTQECTICHKSYLSKSSLKSHISDVHSVKKYDCSHCAIKPFSTISRLKQHMKVHNREYKYSCSICSSSFSFKRELNQHLNIHLYD